MKKLLVSISVFIGLLTTCQIQAESKQNEKVKQTKNQAQNNDKNQNPNIKELKEAAYSEKAQAFLNKERKNISQEFPYRLNIFKKGNIDKNKAGIRISETAKQFDNLGLSGLLFYYKLFDHSMRVPHWHANAEEVGIVLNGKMKITIWDGTDKAKVFTVEQNGSWQIPAATLHALENVGQDELEFIVAYNSNDAADRDFATAWAALPDTLLEQSLGLAQNDIETLKKTTKNRLSLFDPASTPETANISNALAGNFSEVKPLYQGSLGTIRRIDESTNEMMQKMALQQTILNPGAMREPHWYIGGDVLFFVRKGSGFFTMMDSEGKVYSTLISSGDLIFIPVGTFHSYVNLAKENTLEVYEVFNAAKGLSEVTLLNGAQQFSPGTISSATGLSKETVEILMKKTPQNYVIPF